jgi:hypothetical protein
MPAVREVATAASPEKEKQQPAAPLCYGNVIEYIQGIDVPSSCCRGNTKLTLARQTVPGLVHPAAQRAHAIPMAGPQQAQLQVVAAAEPVEDG